MNSFQLWFKSNKFKIIKGEDAQANPLCYGQQLAEWLYEKLLTKGYKVEKVIPEDWGWCVMCSREPFMLWVGCSNVRDYETSAPDGLVPNSNDVVWTCFVVAEQSLISRLFKRVDTTPAIQQLFNYVRTILIDDANVMFVEQP